MKEKILEIHQESFQIYGAPKITKLLQAQGHTVAQRTVTKYMAEEGIKAHYIAPYTNTTRDSDFSINLKNVLKRDFTPSMLDIIKMVLTPKDMICLVIIN